MIATIIAFFAVGLGGIALLALSVSLENSNLKIIGMVILVIEMLIIMAIIAWCQPTVRSNAPDQ